MDSVYRRSIDAFTLVEILMVIAIIGILAAIVIPEFQEHSQQAKESAAKENLRLLRNVIELYAAQHKGVPPGYPNGDITKTPAVTILMLQLMKATNSDGVVISADTAGSLGPYLSKLPENPLNGQITIMVIRDTIPAEATDITGWLYKPLTKTIKLNTPGKDSQGVRYYDY